MHATRIRWQQRAVFVLGGISIGAVAVGFAKIADYAQREFAGVLEHNRLWPIVITPLGFAVSVFAANRCAALGKILLTSFGLLCGASTGREGPTVQVGAALMFTAGRLSPRKQTGLIVAGAAAGIAAAFNTPIAGIIFGIEELTRTFERRTSGLVVSTVVAAGSVSLVLLGNYTYFGTSAGTLQGLQAWLAMPLCGVLGGLLGGYFARLVVYVATQSYLWPAAYAREHPVAFAAWCGLAVAICGLVSGNSTYGTGYDQVKNALDGSVPLGILYMPLKFIATVCSSLSGIPGGIFSPSLAIGAGVGAEIARFFSSVDVGAMMLLGMVAYLTGVVQAPITAFVIVTELTNNRAMLMPLMITALIAYGTARLVCPDGVYHALARNMLSGITADKTAV